MEYTTAEQVKEVASFIDLILLDMSDKLSLMELTTKYPEVKFDIGNNRSYVMDKYRGLDFGYSDNHLSNGRNDVRDTNDAGLLAAIGNLHAKLIGGRVK